MKLLRESDGFTVVETLLVLIFVAIIAFTGYYVWHSKQVTQDTLAQTAKSSSAAVLNSATPECKLTSGEKGVSVTVKSGNFKFCEPNGWLLEQYSGNLGSFWAGTGNIVYDAATKAIVNTSDGGSDGPFTLTINTMDRTKVDTAEFSRSTSAPRLTSGKLTIDSYTHATVANDPVGAGVAYLSEGSKQFMYVVYKGDQALVFHYNVQPGETDRSQLVSEVAASTR
jgi:hypothetical protein